MAKNRKSGRGLTRFNPPAGANVYRGPIKLDMADGDVSTITTNLAGVIPVVTNAGGSILTSYTTDSITSLGEWSTWTGLYREYRVLGLEVSYRPYYSPSFPAPSLVAGYGAVAVAHGSTTTPTSVASVVENSSFSEWNPGMPFRLTWKMASPEESHFSLSSANPNYGGVQVASQNSTASVTLGEAYVRFLVQFRGRN